MTNKMECLLCCKEAILVEQHYPGYQEPDSFSIYDCANCDTQFSFPRIETKHIYEMIYKKGETFSVYNRYHRYKNEVKTKKKPFQYLAKQEEAYWVINETLKQDVQKKKDLKILECGCGLGYLTYSMYKEGFNIIGLDISQNAIDEAIKYFGDIYVCADIFEYAKEHRGEYDRIILTQVIEHVENPVEWIKTLFTMLKNDGKIILSTENKTIYPKNTIWQTDSPPVHLWWFSEKSFEYIANKTNTSVHFTDFSKFVNTKFAIIGEVPYNRHRFDINGEVVNPKRKKKCWKSKIKRISFALDVYRCVCHVRHNVHYLYYKFWKKLPCVWFSKRRNIMGVIFSNKDMIELNN